MSGGGVACALAMWLAAAAVAAAGQPVVGSEHTHVVAPGESVRMIAGAHAMTAADLAARNGVLHTARLKPGVILRVDDRHLVPTPLPDGVVVNVPQRMLFLVEQGRVMLAFPVAAGLPAWPTPRGQFQVVEREIDPVWDVPRSIQHELRARGRTVMTRVLPGPANPLGDRWLGLNAFDIGIHGTNAPTSIYRLVTHGCIRLYPEHARLLYERVPLGMPVTVIYAPVLAAVVAGEWWLEVHPDTYRIAGDRAATALRELGVLGLAADAETRRHVRALVALQSGRPTLVAPIAQRSSGEPTPE
jgi:L,D-transpeptidase ErfK/SrfK